MKLAYLILVHKDPKQLNKLIDALTTENVFFFIHIDKKANQREFTELFKGEEYKNVFFTNKRVKVTWGGYGMIKATLELINMLPGIDIDYVTLLSGQDYPIKSNDKIISFFKENYGKNFIENYPIYNNTVPDYKNGLYRIHYWFFIDILGIKSMKLYKIQEKINLKRKYLYGVIPYYGSQWWSLHIDSINYLKDQWQKKNEVFNFYKRSYIPDESVFQTILMNSDFKDKIVNESLTLVKWNSNPRFSLLLSKNDVSSFLNTNKLFARKFDFDYDPEVVRYIELIRNRETILNTIDDTKLF